MTTLNMIVLRSFALMLFVDQTDNRLNVLLLVWEKQKNFVSKYKELTEIIKLQNQK